MYMKSFILFVSLFICSSCTTFHYYYPSHEFKKRIYTPVKKGLVEMNIRSEATYSERPGHITSRNEAHRRGLKRVKSSIGQFCEGKYLIKKVEEKKENLGTRSDTSYHGSYRTDKGRHRQGAYGRGSQTASGDDMTVSGMRKSIMSNTFGGYMDSGGETERGDQDAYSTTRTAPVFRRYTNITFQCK